jgi:hypothetical protein
LLPLLLLLTVFFLRSFLSFFLSFFLSLFCAAGLLLPWLVFAGGRNRPTSRLQHGIRGG